MTGVIGTLNQVNLAANQSYTSPRFEVKDYAKVKVDCFSDVVSAEGGLVIQCSNDGVRWVTVLSLTLVANGPLARTMDTHLSYMRLKYTNGSTDQTRFYLKASLFAGATDNNNSVDSSIENSTTTSLASSGVFTGEAEYISEYKTVTINIYSDQPGNIEAQFSQDATNWDNIIKDLYIADNSYVRIFPVTSTYFRLVYTNIGSSTQTTLRISTLFSRNQDSPEIVLKANNYDAFGRIKVSEPFTLTDFTSVFPANPLNTSTKTEGGATLVHSSGKHTLTVSNSSDRAVLQSRTLSRYQPGKSLLTMMTGIINAGSNSNSSSSRIGFFNNDNGLFFEYSSGLMKVVLRDRGTDTAVTQSNWNLDNCLGANRLPYIDFTKAQIFVITFEYLGVGLIEFGLVFNGQTYPVHRISNLNALTSGPYMASANLPYRYELLSTGGSATMIISCATVLSEGGYEASGTPLSIDNDTTTISVSTTETPLLGLRLNSAYRQNLLQIVGASTFSANNTNVLYRLRLFVAPTDNPLTGGTWTSVGQADYIIPTSFVPSDSYIMLSGYTSSRSVNTINNFREKSITLDYDLDGSDYDIVLLTAQSFSGTHGVLGTIDWVEFF